VRNFQMEATTLVENRNVSIFHYKSSLENWILFFTKKVRRKKFYCAPYSQEFLIHYQHTNTSLQNSIHVSMVHCRSAVHSVRSLRTTLLLRTTCMRSCCNWNASCVAALQTKNRIPLAGVRSQRLAGEGLQCGGLHANKQTNKQTNKQMFLGVRCHWERGRTRPRALMKGTRCMRTMVSPTCVAL